MNLQEHLRILARQAQSKNSNLITVDEAASWPSGRLDKLIEIGVLIPTRNATSIKCPGCGESVRPTIETGTNGQVYIEVVCRQEGKTIEISPDKLKQWKIVPEKLKKLGYYEEPEETEPNKKPAVTLEDEVETKPQPKPVRTPSKDAIKAYKILNSLGCTQTKVAEIMSNELKRPIAQWQVSRWNTACKNFLTANGLEGFASDLKLDIVTVDPAILDMGKRTDGRRTGDPRHKKKIDPDNAGYE